MEDAELLKQTDDLIEYIDDLLIYFEKNDT